MESFKKFFDENSPDRCKSFNSLKDECIRDKYVLHAINVCSVFKMNTVGDYHDLYLKRNIDMDLFIEKEMKKCLSSITKRFSKANNKYMQFYDDKKIK